jgi:hypothetical protein
VTPNQSSVVAAIRCNLRELLLHTKCLLPQGILTDREEILNLSTGSTGCAKGQDDLHPLRGSRLPTLACYLDK